MRNCLLITLIAYCPSLCAQTLGGSSVYNFLRLSNTPQLTGLGGINISQLSNDIGISFHNPALLRPGMHLQTHFVFNHFYAGIRNYHSMMGYHRAAWNTSFALGINYFDYGTIHATDLGGNETGVIRPVDYVVQLAAARQYGERWYYGATLKFVHSNYGIYRSSAVALDIGISYHDSLNLWQASFAAKNMGAQLRVYTGTAADELPFDLQLGISKRLVHAPLQFSFTAHHSHQFDIGYNDTAFNSENGFVQQHKGTGVTVDQLFRHIVLAAQVYISDKVEISAGYNHLRRKEGNIGNQGNGLNGFSLGLGVLVKRIQLRYARSYYQRQTAWNQFGLNLSMAN